MKFITTRRYNALISETKFLELLTKDLKHSINVINNVVNAEDLTTRQKIRTLKINLKEIKKGDK